MVVGALESSDTSASLFMKFQNSLWLKCKIFGHLKCVGSIDISSYIESPNLVSKFQNRFWALGTLLDELYVNRVSGDTQDTAKKFKSTARYFL